MRRRKASVSQGIFSRCLDRLVELVVAPSVAGISVMHRVLAVLLVPSIAEPDFGQTLLKHEPLYLAPYEAAYVYDLSCGAGMVQKVTG
jgi:hypothetical protein